MSNTQDRWSDSTAIAIHDRLAQRFEDQYASPQSHLDSAFMYGRRLVDNLWAAEVDRLSVDARVLDVGAGVGVYLERLAKRGIDGVGIEPSAEMRARAAARAGVDRIRDGSVTALPFDAASFDFVYCIEVFRYLGDQSNEQGHREILRVLKPGGTYLGTYVNGLALDLYRQLVQLRKLRKSLFGTELDCNTVFENPNGIRRRLKDMGFSHVETRGAMFAPLRIAYKLGSWLGRTSARFVEPFEPMLSDTALTRPFAGHLIVIARK